MENGITKLLANLNPHKAAGPDNIMPRVLKERAIEISPILTLIFNKSYPKFLICDFCLFRKSLLELII
jgi:hypothetical protein